MQILCKLESDIMIIGLLGMGTIGSGVVEMADALESVNLKTILDIVIRRSNMTDKIEDIISDPEIELVVETIGGLHPAYEYAVQAIESGKHFVTANKYLVSVYGKDLYARAKKNGVAFLYSAACGGGIPYLANLEIARTVDQIEALGGILNGTTNFILDSMQTSGMDYADALKEAQALGYAERDPSSDVDGLDTMRKLILASSVGFNVYIDPEDIPTYGISSILSADIAYAKRNNMVLRLCARAERTENGVSAYVEPTLVAASAPESAILKNVNYAWYRGANSGLMSYSGQGAGKLPTASNVIRDVFAAAAGKRYMTADSCADTTPDNAGAVHNYYVRIEAGAAFPESWIEEKTTDGKFDYIRTAPVSVQDMHREMAANKSAFFAGIQKG